jgi:YesN/AraC family two-component response regulator
MLVKQFATTKEIIIKSLITYTYNLAIDDIQFKNFLQNFEELYEDKIDLMDKLLGFMNTNKYINSAYIYVPKRDLFLTTDIGTTYNKNNFYDADFLENINGRYFKVLKQRKVNISGTDYNYISIVCSIMSKNNELLGIFIANINSDDVYKEAKDSLLINDRSLVYSYDSDKKVLYSNNEQLINSTMNVVKGNIDSFSQKNRLLSNYYSPSEGINYVIDMELKGFNNRNIFEYTILSFVITFCLGLVLKLIMSQKVFKPLRKVITNIRDTDIGDEKENSEITFIENAVSNLMVKNVDLKNRYAAMIPLYKEKLLHDIVVRRDYTIEEIKDRLSYYKIDINLNNYIVITLRINKRHLIEEKNRLAKILIRDKIEKLMTESHKGFSVETGKDDISICISLNKDTFDDVDYEAVVKFAENIACSIEIELMISVNMGMGSFVESIENIYKSYEESVEVLNYNKMLKKTVSSIYEVKKFNTNIFEYPYDLENKLLNFIKVGDHKESYLYLDSIFDKIQKETMLTDSEIESIIFLLLGSLNELTYGNGIDMRDESGGVTKMFHVVRNNNLDKVKEEIKNYITRIIDKINVIKGSSTNVINHIIQYIDENYTRDLQLIDLEEKFNLNKYYIGQLIKENTGINFIDYIHKRRIEKSMELLKNSNLTIKDISEAVGYKYAHYFIKLFKKVYGVAPGEYRNKQR